VISGFTGQKLCIVCWLDVTISPLAGLYIMDKGSFYRSEASCRDSVYMEAQPEKELII
jgi:hypothetical protein